MDPPPVQYVTTHDGYNIAYATSGRGRPLVFLPQPISHMQVYWTEDTWVRPWYHGLAERFHFIQYDGRGQGMSTRGLKSNFVPADLDIDLDAVIDRLNLDSFLLMGVQPFGHVAIRYALAHPERVDGLILSSCPISMASWPLAGMRQLGQDWSATLRMQAGLSHAPDISASVERQKKAVDEDDFIVFLEATSRSNVADDLGRLRTPTLVLHPSESLNLPPEESMKLAASIPNARMVLIKGATPLGDPNEGLQAIASFVADLPARGVQVSTTGGTAGGLSAREVEVRRLLAAGRSNQEIGEELVISLYTVNRHVSNIFAKTGARNRTEAASYAHRASLD